MSQVVKLILDLGNSGTRCTVKYFVEVGGKTVLKEVDFDLSNSFARVEKGDYVIPEDYTEATSTMFKLNNVAVGNDTISGTFVNGELCDKEFSKTATRPTALFKKYNNLSSAQSFAEAILIAMKKVKEGQKVETLEELDITWDITVLLPPADIDVGTGKIEAMFNSIKTVEYVLPAITVNINIDSIKVYAEGFCAYVATMFAKGAKIRPNMVKWLQATVLILDIGAGTSDRLIASNFKIIDNSRDTVNIGGNQVTQNLGVTLRREQDLPLPDSVLSEGVKKGFVMDGTKEINIIKEVQRAKNEVAQSEVNSLVRYFEDIQFPVRTLSGLLVCGGGSLEGEVKDLFPLSTSMLTFLKELAPNSELVPLPVDENGNLISARRLNIIGAGILADMN